MSFKDTVPPPHRLTTDGRFKDGLFKNANSTVITNTVGIRITDHSSVFKRHTTGMRVSLVIVLLLIVIFDIKLLRSGSDIHLIAPQVLFHN